MGLSGHYAPRAFTLIEILCVVVIMGIAGAIIIPQVSSRDDLKIDAATRVVMSDLMYAQNLSISRQTRHYLEFTGQSYKVVTVPGGPAIMHPVSKRPYTVQFGSQGTRGMEALSLVSSNFVAATGGSAVAIIGFDELGTPLAYTGGDPPPAMTSGSVVIQSPDATFVSTITVNPFTGALTVTRTN